MRTHGEYSEFQLWPAAPDAATMLRPEHLAVARFELIKRGGFDFGWLDLVFSRDGQTRVLPGILVDLLAAAKNNPSAWLWPRSAAGMLDDDAAYALLEAAGAAVFRLTQSRVIPLESVIRFRPCPPFDAARAAAELGAAPLAQLVPRLAAWIHAARLAGAGPVELVSREAALGAAVLRRYGIAAAGSTDPESAAWYAVSPAERAPQPTLVVADRDVLDAPESALRMVLDGPAPGGPPDWHEMKIPPPVPMDVALTFDPEANAVARRFWVRALPRPPSAAPDPPRPLRKPPAQLAFIVRGDHASAPDADSDEIAELIAWAERAGVGTTLIGSEQLESLAPAAVPVAFGDVRDPGFRAALQALTNRRRPFIAALQPIGAYPHWHEAVLFRALEKPCDDAQLAVLERGYDAGNLALAGVPVAEPPEAQAELGQCATALSGATAIVLAATQDLDVVRASYGGGGRPLLSVLPVVPTDDLLEDATALCGPGPYVLAHAPAAERSQLITVAMALRDSTIPLVIATVEADPGYAATLRRLAGPATIVAMNPPPGLVNALYRGAAIVVDASMRPRGLARIVRATRAGALPVVFADSPLAMLCGPDAAVSPRGVAPLRDALTRFWHSPLRKNQARIAHVAVGKLDHVPDAVEQLFGLFCDVAAL